MDEIISTSDSLKSPEFEYIDHSDSSIVASLERQATYNLHISDHVDLNASPLIEVLLLQTKKSASTNFMDRVQKDRNASMHAILIDWLVEVAEEYRLALDTLYLTINYIDRYLSGNEINRQRLQLLGVACMFIAAKYEGICSPQVEEFCYITDNTYFKDEVMQMEAAILKYLKFEMITPTAKCFLRRFVRVAQCSDEALSLQLEFLANYVPSYHSRVQHAFLFPISDCCCLCLSLEVYTPTNKETLECNTCTLHAVQTFSTVRLCEVLASSVLQQF